MKVKFHDSTLSGTGWICKETFLIEDFLAYALNAELLCKNFRTDFQAKISASVPATHGLFSPSQNI
jgi:hypothetical protein